MNIRRALFFAAAAGVAFLLGPSSAQAADWPGPGAWGGWPTNWTAVPGLATDENVAVTGLNIYGAGTTGNNAVQYAQAEGYMCFRVQVVGVPDTKRTVHVILADNNESPGTVAGFSWTGGSNSSKPGELFRTTPAVAYTTWGNTAMAAPTTPVTGAGNAYVRTSSATVGGIGVTWVDYAISISYLQSATGLNAYNGLYVQAATSFQNSGQFPETQPFLDVVGDLNGSSWSTDKVKATPEPTTGLASASLVLFLLLGRRRRGKGRRQAPASAVR